MKVLTISTLDVIPPEIQRDIHYTLRMEHHTDYVFKDEEASQYTATISLEDTSEVISKIIEYSSRLSEYTIVVDEVDMHANKTVKYKIQAGKLLEKIEDNWEGTISN